MKTLQIRSVNLGIMDLGGVDTVYDTAEEKKLDIAVDTELDTVREKLLDIVKDLENGHEFLGIVGALVVTKVENALIAESMRVIVVGVMELGGMVTVQQQE